MQSALLYTGVMIEYNIFCSILVLLLTMISGVGGNFLLRRNRYLVRILDEERTPPTERTVGDDGVLAIPHQLHVAVAFPALVPVHKIHFVLLEIKVEDVSILPAPFHAAWVAEEYEDRVLHILFDVLDGALEIAELVAVTIATEHVATTSVYGDGIATVKKCCHLLVLSVLELREYKSLPHLLFYSLHSTAYFLQ